MDLKLPGRSPVFATLYLEWYTIIDGRSIKRLPANIFDLLAPVAIAFWIACDGSYSRRDGVITLSTDSYTLVEVQQLQTILLEKFGINSTIGTHGKAGQYLIRIAKGSMARLQSLIALDMPS
jgi:LAGLIDADG DNA endonuclease family